MGAGVKTTPLGTGCTCNILCFSSVMTMIFQGTDFFPGLHKTLCGRMSWPHSLLWSAGASVVPFGAGGDQHRFSLQCWEVSSLYFSGNLQLLLQTLKKLSPVCQEESQVVPSCWWCWCLCARCWWDSSCWDVLCPPQLQSHPAVPLPSAGDRGRTEMPLQITWAPGPVSCRAAVSIFSLLSSYQPPPPAASKDSQSHLPAPGLGTGGKQRGG